MTELAWVDTDGEHRLLQPVWDDGERLYCRTWRSGAEGALHTLMAVLPIAEHPSPNTIGRLAHEFALRDILDGAWAARPLEMVHNRGRTLLLLDSRATSTLESLIGRPLELGSFLRIASAIAHAVGKLHERNLVHKDIKPANILLDPVSEQVWLTGFGITSRQRRERQAPEPPEFIAGTLPYMAPEQTGRMNRSIDSRSDLYALGVTYYQMLTGVLPFAAADPMEWVHCHIARLPLAPASRRPEIPEQISEIVLRLLAKAPEARYQTAAGLETDLRQCLSSWNDRGRIALFPMGASDIPQCVTIPERLYGREKEVTLLLDAFERVVTEKPTELVLVSGYSGVGKSSVVNELHKALVPPRGLFAAGKFDQFKRDIPYATLAQAFQTLIRQILVGSRDEVAYWRGALVEALGVNGQLIVNLIPEVELIVGIQPLVSELPPREAQGRFQALFRRFLGVFARPEHPLALFLDDLQWLDAATLELLKYLVAEPDIRHVLFVGAYRDNEVDAAHPLARTLKELTASGANILNIALQPLTQSDVSRLVCDSLRCEREHLIPLAALVFEKTNGNPFFTIQFITALEEEGLLRFEAGTASWQWDIDRIHAKGYTDNVVDLMIDKLNRLPTSTQESLKQLACLGNGAEIDLLRTVYEDSSDEMNDRLWEAVRAGLIFRSENSYRFLHDRVQEAAYCLIPENQRAETHLRIGRILAQSTPQERLEEAIFDIVNQINNGSHLIVDAGELERAAGLNVIAGKRAKASTAFIAALKYLRAGRALLREEAWDNSYRVIFSVESLMAECELLTADMAAAESRLGMLAQRAEGHHDIAIVTRMQITLYTTLDRSERAIDVFLDYLLRNGVAWSRHPARDVVMVEYNRIWSLVGDRRIEDLVHLPLLDDPNVLDMLDVLGEIVHPAMFFDENLSTLVVCRMVSLCLEHGNCDSSCFGYVWFGMFAGPRFGNYEGGFRFGQLGYDLVEKRNFTRYQARTYISFGTLTPWAKPAVQGRELIKRAFDIAFRTGDLTFSAYSWHSLIANYLVVGDALSEVQAEAQAGLSFVSKAGFGLVTENCRVNLALIRMLRGLTPRFGYLDTEDYSEPDAEHRFARNPGLALAEFFYWTRKLQARWLAGDFGAAVDASLKAHDLLWPAASQVETGEFRFFAALAHAAAWNAASLEAGQRHLERLMDHRRQLEIWAHHCPANFECKIALVNAEVSRIGGRILDAEQFYETAIHSAHENGFVHCEAIANECASTFYLGRGIAKIAQVYLRDARECYRSWGADGKVRQLDTIYPQVKAHEGSSDNGTILASVEQLDLSTVIRVWEAVSGEIEHGKLVHTLMRTALRYAGAERGLLILPHADEYWIEAEATTGVEGIIVAMRQEDIAAIDLPVSALDFVLRSKESLLIHDATSSSFSADVYIRERGTQSVLCLPLLKQAQLSGVLYLENDLAKGVFTPARMTVLKLLASAAAVSLENTRLYTELRERDARVRRLVESNVIGIFIWNFEGLIIDANDAFLTIVGHSRNDLAAGRLDWRALTPPEWRERDDQALTDVKLTGIAETYEKELIAKDGKRIPVLAGAAVFDLARQEGVAFMVDLSDRQRAEDAARDSERRYYESQIQLEHANRVATLGQLSASIAHEVSQPITGVVTNAHTALLCLRREIPDLDAVRLALTRIVRDGGRASDVVSRIRSLIQKAPAHRDLLHINDVIQDVVALTHVEALRCQVTCRTRLTSGLAAVAGDRVQLQQVILNLVMNAIEALNQVSEGRRDIVIGTSSNAENVEVAVHDSGRGVDEEKREKIFDAFYSTKPSGLGMGLSICRSIIAAHGGRLWVGNSAFGGAVFEFTLPIELRLHSEG